MRQRSKGRAARPDHLVVDALGAAHYMLNLAAARCRQPAQATVVDVGAVTSWCNAALHLVNGAGWRRYPQAARGHRPAIVLSDFLQACARTADYVGPEPAPWRMRRACGHLRMARRNWRKAVEPLYATPDKRLVGQIPFDGLR